MDKKTPLEILATRKHEVFNEREEQQALNILCLRGGRPYIDARLQPFQGEHAIHFEGKKGKSGRKAGAFLQNHFAKAIEKVVQYLFEDRPVRDDIDENFAEDVSRSHDRLSINDFMTEATKVRLAGGWCWGKVDRPAPLLDDEGQPRAQSMLEKEERADRVYWTLYSPEKVVDWKFDDAGNLEWLITEDYNLTDNGPMDERYFQLRRIVWGPSMAQVFHINNENGKIEVLEQEPLFYDFGRVPFELYGMVSTRPNKLDDAEMMQSAILNLDSADYYSTLQSCYAQAVYPASMIKELAQSVGDENMSDILVGENHPISEEAEEKGISRFIVPPFSDLMRNPAKVATLIRSLYEVLSMSIRKDTKDAESAESKNIDFKDVASFLACEAQLAQDFENRMVGLSERVDSNFKSYVASYNTDFMVMDIAKRLEAWMQLAQSVMPARYLMEHQKLGLELHEEIAGKDFDTETKLQLLEAINSETAGDLI